LSTRRVSSNQSTASELKIGTTVVLFTGNEENLLFETNIGFNSTGSVETEVLEETASVLVDGGVGSEDGSLLVEGSTVVRNQDGRNKHSVATEENGRRGIDGEVSTGGVSSTETTVRVRGTIGLTLDKSLSLEILNNFIVLVELEHHVLNLSGKTVTDTARSLRLKPMAVDVGTVIKSPRFTEVKEDVLDWADLDAEWAKTQIDQSMDLSEPQRKTISYLLRLVAFRLVSRASGSKLSAMKHLYIR
jgi:hypothetical protein